MRVFVSCAILSILLASTARADTLPPGTLIAAAAFNDDAGLYSDPVANSPYEIGATALYRGVGEPGWAVGWTVSVGGSNPPFGSYYGDIRGDVTHEGDGALRMRNRPSPFEQLWMHRRFAPAIAEKFRIDQYVNIPPGGSFGSRPFGPGSGGLVGRIGPSWSASGGNFYALDGNGRGSTNGEFSGFTWEPNTWYKVSLIVDPAEQTFEFLVDDQRYDAPDPLGFRGSPASIDHISYLTNTLLYIDDIRITAVPEPSALAGLAIGAAGLIVLAVRRRRRRQNLDA